MGAARRFTKEFKRQAVERVLESPDRPIAEIAAELDVKPKRLYQWRSEYLERGEVPPNPGETPQQELERLRKELVRVRQERDFLKKAAAFFARNPE